MEMRLYQAHLSQRKLVIAYPVGRPRTCRAGLSSSLHMEPFSFGHDDHWTGQLLQDRRFALIASLDLEPQSCLYSIKLPPARRRSIFATYPTHSVLKQCKPF